MSSIVKNTTFPSLLDLLSPPSCEICGTLGSILCHRCKNNIISLAPNICPNCKSKTVLGRCQNCLDLPQTFVAGVRSEPIGTLIYNYKFNSTRCLAKPLTEIMFTVLSKTLPREPLNPLLSPSKNHHESHKNYKTHRGPENVIIVPLPTIAKHIRERGFDHTYLLARHLSRLTSYRLEKLLLRAKNTVQVGSDAKTRKTQANHAYALNPKIKIDPSATYLLLDDIWTTGASMKAALNKLREAGIENIIIAVLAVNKAT
ncbi:MAG: phosphoribosyltransferase family protein [Candidatus Saccharibacteria bacterium]|nr:phosphoribosyltransferase family protein [Candidatus Saccharibacteria bacterium]